MLRHIERLRTKPKAVRIQAAFMTAAVLTSLVVLFWVISLPSQLADLQAVFTNENQDTETVTGRPYWQKLQVALGLEALSQPDTNMSTNTEDTSTAAAELPLSDLLATASTTTSASTSTTTTEANSVPQPTPRIIRIATTSASSSASSSRP